jgi:hypothetical protein
MNFFNAYAALINNKIITRNNFEYCLKFFPAINSTVLFVRFIKEDGTVESFWSGLEDAIFTPNDLSANDWIIKDELQ